MRKISTRLVTVLLVLAVALGAGSQAVAQDYPPVPPIEPATIDCTSSLPVPTITFTGTTLVITFSELARLCIANVVVELNPVLYNGPVPASRVLRLNVPAEYRADGNASVTVTGVTGTTGASAAKWGPTGGAAPAAAAAGTSQPAAALAFTGSSANVTMALGAALIGSGGLLVLAGRKRKLDS